MARKRYKIHVQVESPLALGDGRWPREVTLGSREIVPGSVLRGAVANALIELSGKPDATFGKIMVDGSGIEAEITYPFLYLSGNTDDVAEPLPLTARECKRFPWSEGARVAIEHHGIWDILFETMAFDQLIKADRDPDRFAGFYCSKCGNPVEPARHYIRWLDRTRLESGGALPLEVHTRVAISRSTQTAVDGMLYSIEGYRCVPGRTYALAGEGTVDDGLADSLKGIEGLSIRLGGKTGRGYGNARITSIEIDEDDSGTRANFDSRVKEFNETWNKRISSNDDSNDADGSQHVSSWLMTIDLLSPLVPDNPWTLTGYDWARNLLNESLVSMGFPGVIDDISEIRVFARGEDHSGWNAAWGLPKRVEQSIAAGSVFCLMGTDTIPDDLKDAMYALEMKGVGAHRQEGLGRVRICSPFHYRFAMPIRE